MAAIAKSGTPSLASVRPPQNEQIPGLTAGEDIAAFDLCTIAVDGTVMRSTEGDTVHGVASETGAQLGEPLTLYRNVRARYGAGLTPGATVYQSETAAGGLDDAAGASPVIVGYVVDATRIQFRNL